MRATKSLLALLTALLLLPLGNAETTFNTPTEAVLLDPEGDQTIDFTASLSCDEFLDAGTLEGQGSQTRDVTLTYPEGITGTESVTFTFDGSACIESGDPQGSVESDNKTITITPGPTAPGMVQLGVNLTSDEDAEDTGSIPIQVDYRKGYFLDVHQDFPVTVQKDEEGEWIPVQFTADIVLTANANTMVMMLVTDRSEFGSMSGLFTNSPHIFRDLTADELQNGITKTVTFSYTPTAEDWQEDTVELITWSHWLDNGTMKTDDQPISWTFINGEFDEKKDTPGFGPGLAAIALVAAALIAARRRT